MERFYIEIIKIYGELAEIFSQVPDLALAVWQHRTTGTIIDICIGLVIIVALEAFSQRVKYPN